MGRLAEIDHNLFKLWNLKKFSSSKCLNPKQLIGLNQKLYDVNTVITSNDVKEDWSVHQGTSTLMHIMNSNLSFIAILDCAWDTGSRKSCWFLNSTYMRDCVYLSEMETKSHLMIKFINQVYLSQHTSGIMLLSLWDTQYVEACYDCICNKCLKGWLIQSM